MKKILLFVAVLIAIIPMVKVNASEEISLTVDCGTDPVKLGNQKVCTIYGSPKSGTFTNVNITVTSGSGARIDNIEVNTTDFTATVTNGKIVGTANTPQGSMIKIATVTTTILATTDCGIKVSAGTTTIDKPFTPTPTDPSTPENPNTGGYMPYILIGGAAIVAVGIYTIATKKTKFYKV